MEALTKTVCQSCRQRLATRAATTTTTTTKTTITSSRHFTSSTARSVIPPESPQYIDVPSSYQPFLPYRKPDKGFLPTPRELFPANKPEKVTQSYLQNVTQEPSRKRPVSTPAQKHKAKMAELRRDQLREGLTGLRLRKMNEVGALIAVSQRKQVERSALLAQAEREDARLTSVSVPKAMQESPATSVRALQDRVAAAKELHALKVANYEQMTARKHADKMDALHTLYMNARSFITTEADLLKLISDQFDPTPLGQPAGSRHADFNTDDARGMSMWNIGPPDSVQKMIHSASATLTKKEDSLSRVNSGRFVDKAALKRDQARFKKIAEKLSGGKL